MSLYKRKRKLNTAYEETYVFTNNEEFMKLNYTGEMNDFPGAVVVDTTRYLNVELDLTWIPKNWTIYSLKLRFKNLEQIDKYLYVKKTSTFVLRGTEVYDVMKSENGYYEIDLAGYFDTNYSSKKYITIDGLGEVEYENYCGVLTLFSEGKSEEEPQLIITYYENDKLLSGKTINGNVGKSLSYNVNLLTGKSVYTKPLLQIVNTVLPINLELLFDGNNSRFTYDQSVVKNDEGYEYTDGFGYRHQFITSLNDEDIYFDTAGTGLILTKNLIDYTITDDNGNYLSFDSNGLLDEIAKIISNNRFSILLTRDNLGRLTGISESLFFEEDDMPTITSRVNISYTDTNITITSTGFNNVVLTKDENCNIVSITEEDNRLSEYGYNDDNLLITARYDNGENVEFTYDTFKRVTDITNKVGDNVVSKDTLEYHNLLTYNTNFFNTKMAYVFDEDGVLIGSYEIVLDLDNNEEKVNLKYIKKSSHSIESNLNETKTYIRYDDVLINGVEALISTKILEANEDKSKGSLEIKKNVKYSLSFIYSFNKLINFNNSKTSIKVTQNGENLYEETLPFVKYKEVMHSIIFETTTYDDIVITICHTHVIGDISIKSATLSEMKMAGAQTVISGDVGGEAIITIDNGENADPTVWYSLINNTFTYGNLNIKVPYQMYKDDLEENLKNIGTDNSSYNIWYNHKRGLIVHTDNVKLVGDKTVNLEEIKIGTVSLVNNQYYINYSDYANNNTIDNYLRTDYTQVISNGIVTLMAKMINKDFQVVKEIDKKGIIKEYTYNSYGNVIQEKMYSDKTTQLIVKQYSYNKVTLFNEITNINGTTSIITYTTDSNTGLITKIKYPNNLEEIYEYVQGTTKLAKIKAIVNGVECSNVLTYNKDKLVNSKGMCNGISQNYDDYNMLSRVYDGGRYLITNNTSIESTGITITRYTGASNYFFKEEYDKYGNLFQVSESSTNSNYSVKKKLFYSDKDVSLLEDITNPNDSNLNKKMGSMLRKVEDKYIDDIAEIYYDNDGSVKEIAYKSKYRPLYIMNSKDEYGRIDEIIEVYSDTNTKQSIEYENAYDNEIKKITTSMTYSQNSTSILSDTITKDEFGRLSKEEFLINNLNTMKKEYTYLTNGVNTTNLVSNIKFYGRYNGLRYNFNYTYDNMGRIISVYGFGGIIDDSYEYDLLGRLVRENNKKLNKTFVYTYDGNGNITRKEEGAYTTGTFTASKTYNYEYSPFYSDILTKYNNLTVSFTNKGNITQIGLVQYNWTRDKYLSRVYKSSYEYINMSYDADGNRYKKEYYKNGTTITHEYITDGKKILREIITGGANAGTIFYMYNGEELVGFTYKNKEYYFQRDLKGDIIEIWDNSTSRVARYVYDAWGNHKVYDSNGYENTTDTFIGNINPFRYRGYYYDVETNLFLVTSRYYSPELGRFIQPADVSSLDSQSINGLNLYSYANNNPIGTAYSSSNVGGASGGGMINSIGGAISNVDGSGSVIGVPNISGFSSSSGLSLGGINWPKVNSVEMTHYTTSLIENPYISWMLGNISYTKTVQLNSAETFYSFRNIGNDGYSVGVCLNLGNWYGSSIYVSSDYGFGGSWQVRSLVTGSYGWSLENGISISGGIIVGDTTHEITISVGNGALLGYAVCAWVAALPAPGARAVAATAAFIIFMVDLFN